MAEKLCEVAVVDEHGVRHALEIAATSVNQAAITFWAKARTEPALNMPPLGDATVYEVRVIGEDRVHSVGQPKLLEWARRESERRQAKGPQPR